MDHHELQQLGGKKKTNTNSSTKIKLSMELMNRLHRVNNSILTKHVFKGNNIIQNTNMHGQKHKKKKSQLWKTANQFQQKTGRIQNTNKKRRRRRKTQLRKRKKDSYRIRVGNTNPTTRTNQRRVLIKILHPGLQEVTMQRPRLHLVAINIIVNWVLYFLLCILYTHGFGQYYYYYVGDRKGRRKKKTF
jgi:hypothetical protein